jgi:N-methylhydantoinase B
MSKRPRSVKSPAFDPIELAVFKNALHSIAEEMGAALRRTSFSPNIKERRDYSTALFDETGQLIVMGEGMPVHLGSMPMSVRAVLQALTLDRDDVAMVNDPFAGGTHLPDITMVTPVHLRGMKRPAFYVANRAHHADVGGAFAGSMGPAREIYQEGFRILPVKVVRRGGLNHDVMALLLNNVRTPQEREGDLTAQIGTCRLGARRLESLTARYGFGRVARNVTELLDYSERLIRAELARWPEGEFAAEDFLDDDGIAGKLVKIHVRIRLDPRRAGARVDFSGSSPQVPGAVNAVYAITYSAAQYVFLCLLPAEAPRNAGLMRPVEVIAPLGTVVNARSPAAVAGGNVETSQRIVDVLLRALAQAVPQRIPAASSGTMNNLAVGGIDARAERPFAYYETVAGGMGARPGLDGISGVHTHMTNSRNTPVEALEYAVPLRVRRYSLRPGSGGAGKFRGGDGIIREIEFLSPAEVSVLADRRRISPYGLAGGAPGALGRTQIYADGAWKDLPGKCNLHVEAGAVLRIETPGGGGWGRKGGVRQRVKRARNARRT